MYNLTSLNFPEKYQIRLKQTQNGLYIFCVIRKKWLSYTPEEWVRQHTLHYLNKELKYPLSIIGVEVKVRINGMEKRADIVLYQNTKPYIIVECKAHHITINQQVFDQIARYQFYLEGIFLMLTNGLHHYYCQIDSKNKTYHFMQYIPSYKQKM